MITSDRLITTADIGKILVVIATDNLTITLDQQRNFDLFSIIKIRVICVPNKCIKILPSAGEQIDFGGSEENELYLLDGEFLNLVTNSDVTGGIEGGRFILDGCSDSLFTVGEEVKAKAIIHNTQKQTGQELNRLDYARLWKWIVANYVDGQQLVTDAVWLGGITLVQDGNSETVTPYRGCVSKGNGTTTFRLPDDRGMFERIFDDGRGIDNSRLWNAAGGYEHDRVKKHNHTINIWGQKRGAGSNPDDEAVSKTLTGFGTAGTFTTTAMVGPENLVKNIAKYSLIRL